MTSLSFCSNLKLEFQNTGYFPGTVAHLCIVKEKNITNLFVLGDSGGHVQWLATSSQHEACCQGPDVTKLCSRLRIDVCSVCSIELLLHLRQLILELQSFQNAADRKNVQRRTFPSSSDQQSAFQRKTTFILLCPFSLSLFLFLFLSLSHDLPFSAWCPSISFQAFAVLKTSIQSSLMLVWRCLTLFFELRH